ncbi:MAG: alpha/beta hydrolase [Bacteroidales bacterium]|nr:alpha/beta hydrolase [Bacteroidales bacterium]
MKNYIAVVLIVLSLTSCQKEKISIGTNASDTFYVDNAGASMRVLVEGNTSSHTFVLFVAGGPGASSFFYNTDYIKNNIADKYACVFWDQRNSGASQGNSNGSNLNLPQMTDDLKKVIEVIKYRYGENSSVFLLGHSFGGLLTASFMTTGDNQNMVKGWIYADGSHNYPLNDTLTRQMLITVGQQQIAENQNTDQWFPIVDYCESHTGGFSLDESFQLEDYAEQAETLFSVVKQVNLFDLIRQYAIKDNWPLTSILFNYLYSSNDDFNQELAKTDFTSQLYKVTTPTLIMYGEYDFVCPKGLGEDLYNHISSPEKKMVISPISGHDIFLQDQAFFCDQIDQFVLQNK